MNCVISMWTLTEGGGGVKAYQDGLEHFFPKFAQGCKGLPGWFGTFFFHIFTFDREGGGDLSDLGNAHIEPTHFKKELPFPKNIPPFPQYWGRVKAC